MRNLKLVKSKFLSEKGAIAIIVATFFSTGFIFSMFALVVDVGAIQFEKRTLQNAANSAVVSTAINCALSYSGCSSSIAEANTAKKYLNANSQDGRSQVNVMCGASPLSPCSTPTSCKTVSSAYPNYLRVVSSTENSDNSYVLKPIFAGIFDPNLKNGYSASACAQATWGRAAFANVQPIGVPICLYSSQNVNTAIPMFSTVSGTYTTCVVKDVDGKTFNAPNMVNGFSFINFSTGNTVRNLNSNCETNSAIFESSTGITNLLSNAENLSKVCVNSATFLVKLQNWITSGSSYFLPAMGSVSAQGGNAINYPVLAFFKFKLLGFYLNSGRDQSVPAIPTTVRTSICGSRDCIYGTFTKGMVPTARVSTDTSVPSVGALAVEVLP